MFAATSTPSTATSLVPSFFSSPSNSVSLVQFPLKDVLQAGAGSLVDTIKAAIQPQASAGVQKPTVIPVTVTVGDQTLSVPVTLSSQAVWVPASLATQLRAEIQSSRQPVSTATAAATAATAAATTATATPAAAAAAAVPALSSETHAFIGMASGQILEVLQQATKVVNSQGQPIADLQDAAARLATQQWFFQSFNSASADLSRVLVLGTDDDLAKIAEAVRNGSLDELSADNTSTVLQ